jgi:son of sevenless-like protein
MSSDDSHLPSRNESTTVPRPRTITHLSLAVALTALEQDQYNRILPADFISYLQNPSDSNNLSAAYATSKKIVCWAKKAILQPEELEGRVEAFKFFLNTAHVSSSSRIVLIMLSLGSKECRRLRNFQSMVAIVTALQSSTVQRLIMTTKEAVENGRGLQAILHSMEQLLRPDQYHQRYRDAVRQSTASCIPWIGKYFLLIDAVVLHYQIYQRCMSSS